MADPGIQALRAGPETLSGSPMPFRFEVTWRSLTRPLEPARASSLRHINELTARQRPARDPEIREWEMVLPRTPRPITPPSFALAYERARGRWITLAGALTIAVAIAGVYWSRTAAPQASQRAAATDMGGAGWMAEWASDQTGSSRGRQLSLYRPSMPMADYRLEFSGQIGSKSLGWVFRAKDTRNYYVGKLETSGGAAPLRITRFAVVGGVEGAHFQRTLAHLPGPWKVRQEARGSKFTIYLQNQIVEDWQDDRLKTGGVGFLNERTERGQVESVQISFLKGGVGR